MRRLPDFWRCLEQRPDTASPLERWRRAAKADFDVLERFLVPDGDALSPVYPCPKCGRDLMVVPLGDANVAEPEEGDTCPPVEGLAAEDVRAYVLDWAAIFSAISDATGLPITFDGNPNACACARGALARDFRRVMVSACLGYCNSTKQAEALRLIRAKGGALLMTGCYRQDFADLLSGSTCGYAALEDAVGADPEGRLVCPCDIGECVGGRDVTVREMETHFGGRIDAVGERVVQQIGDKLDMGFARVLGARQADFQKIGEQRETIEDMAEGPDKFLAGLQKQLNENERILFFDLITKIDVDGRRKVQSYSEIGKRLGGITKQAVHQKVKSLFDNNRGVEDYVEAVRKPAKPVNFSEMKPSDRRKVGVDASYDHDVS